MHPLHRHIRIDVLVVILVLLSYSGPVRADEASDRAEITNVVQQYALGFYQRDATAIQELCHRALSKHGVATTYFGQPFEHLDEITYEQLGWLGAHYNAEGRFDPATARKDVRVLDLIGDYAAAELIAADWTDFFHLLRIDGKWTIVNVVWWGDVPADEESQAETDRDGIVFAVNEYIQGFYHGEPDRTVSRVHDQLDKRTLWRTDHGDLLREMGREALHHVAAVGNVGENRKLDPATSRADVTIHAIHGNIASARLDAQTWFDLFHLVRIDGVWTIVNVAWAPTAS